MSTTVDERVVSMQFDNKHFEKNVETSMSTLDKLKKSLKLKGATEGFENLDAAQKRVNFKDLEYASYNAGFQIKDVWLKVASVFEYQVAGRIISSAKNIANALTLQPITTGLKEYETQMGAIQTILANTESKGSTLDDVNSALDELNTYADKTIYNFTEMTKNIGTFTAAGVDLDTSVQSIKGIANLAAISGSTSQQASTAMYQLSQAMASGTVKLMDWNSVVNAGMGGQVFQDALKATAKVHGVAIDEIISKNGSFRESLSEGWLTTEILTDTLAKFTMYAEEGTEEWETLKKSLTDQGYTEEQAKEILKMGKSATEAATKVKTFTQLFDTLKESAQSGWAQTWEIIIGDFEEAKEFLTYLSDEFGAIIGASADARNELLSNWKALGGRTDLLDSIKNIIEGIKNLVTPIADAWKELFPPTTAEQLKSVSEGIKNATAAFAEFGSKHGDNIKRTFQGIFAVVRIVVDVFKALFKAIKPVFGATGDLAGGILGITAAIGDFLVWISELIRRSDILNITFSAIGKVLAFVIGMVADLTEVIKKAFKTGPLESFQSFTEKIADRISSLSDSTSGFGDGVKETFKSLAATISNSPLFKLLKTVWNAVTTVFKAITNAVGGFFKNSLGWIENASFVDVIDLINNLVAGGLGIALIKIISGINEAIDNSANITNVLEGLVDKFKDIISPLTDCFKQLQEQIKANIIKTIATSILMLAAALLVIAFIPEDNLYRALVAIGALFTGLSIAIKIIANSFSGIGKGGIKGLIANFKQFGALSKVITSIGTTLLLMAVTLKILSTMSWEDIGKGLVAMVGMLAILTGVVFAFSKISSTKKMATQGAKEIRKLAGTLLLLTVPLMLLSLLKWEAIGRGLTAMLGALAILTGVVFVFSKIGSTKNMATKGANELLKLAGVLVIITIPLMLLSTLNWGAMARAGASLLGVLTVMVAAQVLLSKFGSAGVKGTAGLVIMASAITLMAAPLMLLSTLNWGAMARAGASLLGVLTVMVAAQVLLSKFGSGSVKGSAGLVIMSSAILIIVPSFIALSALNWSAIAKAGVSLLAMLTMLVSAQVILNKFGSTSVKGATGLVIMVSAILLLVPALLLLAALPVLVIAKGLLTIATSFLVLGGLSLLLSPLAPIILTLATAFKAIGVGALALGAALILAGIGLTMLSAGLVALSGAFNIILASMGVFSVVLVELTKAVIVGIITGLGEGIVAICQLIADSAYGIADAIIAVLLAVIDMLATIIPALGEAIMMMLVGALDYVAAYTAPLVGALMKILIGIIQGVADYIQPLVQAVVDVLFGLIQGVISALAGLHGTEGLTEALLSCSVLLIIMGELAAMYALTPMAVAGVAGLVTVAALLTTALTAIAGIAQIPGIDWVLEESGAFLQKLGNAIGQFVGGLAGGIAEGFSESLPLIGTNLSDFMVNLKPFIDGASSITPETLTGVKSLVEIIASITGANIRESIASWLTGEDSITAFSTDIVTLGEGIAKFSDAVVNVNAEKVKAATDALTAIAQMTNTIPNSGGVVAWFSGDNSISAFANDLPILGDGISKFSDSVANIETDKVKSAAEALVKIAEMTSVIPNSGGVEAWFAGDNSISKYACDLPELGLNIARFSEYVAEVMPDRVKNVAEAAKSLVDMTNAIPNSGGIAGWFAGEQSISKYAYELPKLGSGIAGFAKNIGENFSPENITAAASAAKSLAEMVSVIPKEGGVAAWFGGEQSISKFSDELPKLGTGLSGFAKNVGNINADSVKAAASAASSLAGMTKDIPVNIDKISKFGDKLKELGTDLKSYFTEMSKISSGTMSTASKALGEVEKISKVDSGKISSLSKAIDKLTDSVSKMAKDIKSDLKDAGKEAIESFIKGINDKLKAAKDACTAVIDACVEKLKGKYESFKSAGKHVVNGFAAGISEQTFAAEAKAAAMAKAAKEAAEEALGIQSPSKVFYGIGGYAGQGFINALSDYERLSYDAGSNVASSAKSGLSDAISKITDVINGDMDMQPTIRPVLDLTDVKSGVNSIGSMLGFGSSVGVAANLNAIGSSMNGNNQNGDIISAIDKLRKDLGNLGSTTYNVNGVTYDDGTNIAEAVKSLVKAAIVERRI